MGQCLEKSQSNQVQDDKLSLVKKSIVQEQPIQYVNRMTTQLSEFEEKQKENEKENLLNIQQFKLLKTLGRGTYGKVLLVKKKSDNTQYAIKIISKKAIKEAKMQEYIKTERFILENITNPFVSKLYFAFQSKSKLYLVMDFCQGGELFFHLRRAYQFNEEQTKFYAAEIVQALDSLHQKKILYRDLKPENVMLTREGHIKLIDFGLSKIMECRDALSHSFVGTPEYLAPEILDGQHNEQSDWWSLGALIYEMLTGAAPFFSIDKSLMQRNRKEKQIEMKPWFSESCQSLLKGLLTNDANQRLRVEDIRNHDFFNGIEWDQLLSLKPPIIPQLKNSTDVSYFNKMFTDEPAEDSDQEECDEIYLNFEYN